MRPGVDAFLVYQGKILLVQRDSIPSIPYPNLWNLPGGGVDDGESEDIENNYPKLEALLVTK